MESLFYIVGREAPADDPSPACGRKLRVGRAPHDLNGAGRRSPTTGPGAKRREDEGLLLFLPTRLKGRNRPSPSHRRFTPTGPFLSRERERSCEEIGLRAWPSFF